MATNNDLLSIKNLINRLYGTYITDNRTELKYMSGITDPSLTTGNAFHEKIQKIFALNVNNTSQIILSTANGGTSFADVDNFKYILEAIISLLNQIKRFITKSTNYEDKFSKLTAIKITAISVSDETLKEDSNQAAANNMHSGTILTIANIKISDASKITLSSTTYTKGSSLQHQSITDLTNPSCVIILSNHIYYLLNTSTDSLNLQVNALLAYYKLVQFYFRLYETSEKLLLTTSLSYIVPYVGYTPGNLNVLCAALSTLHTDLNNEKTTYINNVYSDNDIQNQPDITVASTNVTTVTRIGNPIIIEFTTPLITSNYNYYEDNYIFKYKYTYGGNTITLYFPIRKFTYNGSNNITKVHLDDTNNDLPKIFTEGTVINHTNILTGLTTHEIKIIKKDLNYLKKDYDLTEEKLKEYNNDIEENKRKINNTVLKYDINSNKIDILKIQLNIYYCIYGIIIFLLLGLNLYEFNNNTKQIISLIIIVIIIISILVNYYIKQKYIEEFKENFFATSLPPPTCNAAVYSNTTSRLKYIQDHIDVFVPATKIYLENLLSYLPSLNTISLYTKILTSMNKEKKQFNKINKEYHNKFLNGVENTNMVFNEIINYSAYIYLISFTFLIIALLYLSYLLIPDYIKIFLFIALLLFVIVMWIYIYNIKEIVRSNSYNKYWIKPSGNTLNELKRS